MTRAISLTVRAGSTFILWQSTGKTVVFVTHDLEEAVFLADRIVVLASRPGRVHEIVANPLLRPRMEEARVSDAFTTVKRAVWSSLQAARQASAQIIRGGGNA